MLKKTKSCLRSLFFLGALAFVSVPAQAQGQGGAGDQGGVGFDAKEAFGTILVAGLVGGVLGLSTLSFYEKPNEHLRNITLGAGAAMIGAALYMTFNLAKNPEKVEGAHYDPQPYELSLVPLIDTEFQGLSLATRF